MFFRPALLGCLVALSSPLALAQTDTCPTPSTGTTPAPTGGSGSTSSGGSTGSGGTITTNGDEAGKAKGLKSKKAGGTVHTSTGSSTTQIEGRPLTKQTKPH